MRLEPGLSPNWERLKKREDMEEADVSRETRLVGLSRWLAGGCERNN